VGIATTLAVLVGAASAAGYGVLQDDKQPPPPATTVAQTPPATTPSTSLPPATQEPPPYAPTPYAPSHTPTSSGGGPLAGAPASHPNTGGTSPGKIGSPARPNEGSVEPAPHVTTPTTPSKPQFALTDVALGAAAIAYAPYASADVDLGDPSRAVDGSIRTAWKAPQAADATAPPQLGVYVDLAGKEKLRALVLKTPTPGMNIEVYGANGGPPDAITDPGWDHLASRSGIAAKTRVKLGDSAYRYVLVWIVGAPPDGARPAISELSLLSLQPE
jgi:hypothetical protein